MLDESQAFKIGFYPYRGTVNICRMLCQYLNLPYQNLLFNPCTWKNFKQENTKNWHFQELPFLIDGPNVVTQTYPICQYIIRKSGQEDLLGKNLDDNFVVDSFMWGRDLIQSLLSIVVENKNNPKKLMEEIHGGWYSSVRNTLILYEKGAKSGQFYLGYLTIIDFIIHETIEHFKDMFKNQIPHFAKLIAIWERVSKLPQVKRFESSNKNIKQMCPLQFYKNWKSEAMRMEGTKNPCHEIFNPSKAIHE